MTKTLYQGCNKNLSVSTVIKKFVTAKEFHRIETKEFLGVIYTGVSIKYNVKKIIIWML